MIFLKFSELRNLNAINLFARMNLDNKNIQFLPSYQDNYGEEEQKEKKEKEEEEEEIEETEEEESEENSDSNSSGNDNDNVIQEEDIDSGLITGYKNMNDSSINESSKAN